jgi:glycosyltransferase involved in cell wall biosynthesis
MDKTRFVIASRCAWTTFNFRRQLIEELQHLGAEVIACGAGGDGYEARLHSAGIRFEPLPLGQGQTGPVADLRYLVACYRLFRRFRPNVLHAFTVKPVIFASIAARAARVPVRVVMITGLGHVFTSSGRFLRGLISALYRIALKRVNLVYFQNPDDRDEFLRQGIVSVDQSRLIAGSGVDTKRFAPILRCATAPGTVFVMVARMLREKGVMEFLSAASRVRSRTTGTRFMLVGGTDPRNPTSLEADEIRLAATDVGVEWIGHVEDVRPYYAQADIVVLPSYREGTPMSLLEAAAMAKPMIATRVPGCIEIVHEGTTGWLVPPRDAFALAEAMLRAIAERDHWDVYGDNARALATSRFDSRVICQQILNDYEELLGRSIT